MKFRRINLTPYFYRTKLLYAFVLFVLTITSCIPAKDIKYLQGNLDTTQTKKVLTGYVYRVQPNDNLYIKLTSLDPAINQFLNPGDMLMGSANLASANAKYKDIYVVSDSGYIDLPQTGKLYVKNLKLEEIKNLIETSINYKETTVSIRLAEYYITILGAVNRPGKYLIDRERITIFDLLGTAGDIMENANRRNVKLIRETESGILVQELDLTSKSILTSDYFYLRPNDVIYIEPHKATYLEARRIPFSSTLSLIISTTTFLFFIFNNIK